jgi:oligopeptide/dipeptide ABC transporter ATP-binding protein
LLSVRGLTVSYRLRGINSPFLPAITGVDLDVYDGDAIGIFGESGCGKSTFLLAIANLLPSDAISGGSVLFGGHDLLKATEHTLQTLRGAQIGFVVQESGTALNPVRRVGKQVAEVLRAHANVSRAESQERARAALERVGLGEERIYRSWPHQLSGGQRQRVLIAQALICSPKLMLADEPTHALDPANRLEIATLFAGSQSGPSTALIIASHDPAVVRSVTKRLVVFYAGQVVESGRTEDVLGDPLHPYTRALVDCFRLEPRQAGDYPFRMRTIPGTAPQSNGGTNGCRFAIRCPHRRPSCAEQEPALRNATSTREVRCFLYGD